MKPKLLETLPEIRRAAMDALARREHSRHELWHTLRRRIQNTALLDTALDQLIKEKLLSDRRFCEAFVRSRMNNGYGPVRVKAELNSRGVADQIISEYLNEEDQGWRTRLSELISRKYGPKPAHDVKSTTKRQRFLQQRGYTFSQIHQVLREFDS